MLRSLVIKIFLQAVLASLCLGQPPNVVFFLVDDLGYMDIGANNSETFYETPNAWPHRA